MARVSTESVFPTIAVSNGVLSIALADLPGLTAAEAAGGASNIREFAKAIDLAIANALAPLATANRPTGFTKTVGTPTTPVAGQQTVPVNTTYTLKNALPGAEFIDEV